MTSEIWDDIGKNVESGGESWDGVWENWLFIPYLSALFEFLS
jgi:hypothetical protein